jgi:anti-sigma factor RsiW
VNDKRCPTEDELLRFIDMDLLPEQLERVERHLESCGPCSKQVRALRELVADVAAPIPDTDFDVGEHVAGVMKRLEAAPAKAPRASRLLPWAGGLAAAAALVLFVTHGRRAADPEGHFTARGGPAQASLSRDVGVQLYAQETSLRPLQAGERIGRDAAITAGLRNLGRERVYLLLFAVDSRSDVHWIAPVFMNANENPVAVSVTPSTDERLLPTAATFDDLAQGPLRIVALVTREAVHVADIESLPATERSGEALMKRFPHGEVRQFLLDVAE